MFCDVVLAGAYVFFGVKQRAVVYSVAYIFDARKKKKTSRLFLLALVAGFIWAIVPHGE